MPEAADDLTASPWTYPGTAAGCSGLLEGGRFTPQPADALVSAWRRHDGRSRRTAVVAVGSNASPAVMQRKLSRHGVGGCVPLVVGSLAGCAVGHSAHVSVPGFVPAAPYLRDDARTSVYVTLLDDSQLRCVDRTEPNYVRRRLQSGRCVLETEDSSRPESFDLYDSQWGVLAEPGGSPVPFGSQAELYALLRAWWPAYAELLGEAGDGDGDDGGDGGVEDDTGEHAGLAAVQSVMRVLAADQRLRDRVREAFAVTGWARPSGLADV
jgi:hypothetical protein